MPAAGSTSTQDARGQAASARWHDRSRGGSSAHHLAKDAEKFDDLVDRIGRGPCDSISHHQQPGPPSSTVPAFRRSPTSPCDGNDCSCTRGRTADLPIQDRSSWLVPDIARHHSLAVSVSRRKHTSVTCRFVIGSQPKMGIKWGVDGRSGWVLGVGIGLSLLGGGIASAFASHLGSIFAWFAPVVTVVPVVGSFAISLVIGLLATRPTAPPDYARSTR